VRRSDLLCRDAQAFTQQARTLAAGRGINCVTLDYDALRGMEPNTPTLF
jgi:RecB family endonuclease NucS